MPTTVNILTFISTKFILLINANLLINVKMPTIADILTFIITKFILLIKVKTPTIVGILTFISSLNTTSECLSRKNLFFVFSFYEQLKFHAKSK